MQFTTNDKDQDNWEGNCAMDRTLDYLLMYYHRMQFTTYYKDSWELQGNCTMARMFIHLWLG